MKRTHPSTLVAFTVGGLAFGYLGELALVSGGSSALVPPVSLAITLVGVAAIVVAMAWPIRQAVRGSTPRRINPFRAARVAVLAKASSVTGALVLGVGILLFSRGWMGGGDAKLSAAAASWFTLAELPWFALAVVLIGGALTLVLLPLRRALARPGEEPGGWAGLRRGRSIPYGVAIAAGAILIASSPSRTTERSGIEAVPAFAPGAKLPETGGDRADAQSISR